jgi:hypothetical protein
MLRSAALDRCSFSAVGSCAYSKQQALQCRRPFSNPQPLSRRDPGRQAHCRGVHCLAWQRPTRRHAAQPRRARTSALADASMQSGHTAPADDQAHDNFLVARVRGALGASWLSTALKTPQASGCYATTATRVACEREMLMRPTPYRGPHVHLTRAPTDSYGAGFLTWLNSSSPPKWLWRTISALILGGQVMTRMLQGGHPSRPQLPWPNLPAEPACAHPSHQLSPGAAAAECGFVRSCTLRQRMLAPLGTCEAVNCRQDPLAQHAGAAVAGGAALAGRRPAYRQLRGHGLHHPGGDRTHSIARARPSCEEFPCWQGSA